MFRALPVALMLVVSTAALADGLVIPPPELVKQLTADGPQSLPKYMTETEKKFFEPRTTIEDFLFRAPPTGEVYCPAEYEHNDGIFFAWEGFTDLLTTMTTAITTNDEDTIVHMVVDSSSEQSTVYSTLSSAGADMDQVEFIIRTTDTVWIRDYGPRFIYEDDEQAIVDHDYNRYRPNDNALNDYVTTQWGIAGYDIPLTHGGGNFHLFANGDAFMSDLILNENPALEYQDVIDLYSDYQNLNLTIYPGFPTSFDSTQHIDMWMLPVGDFKIIIGQYNASTGDPYTITEAAVTDLQARGYTVYRTPGWNSGGTHYTYTNAIIVNDLVFVPQFSGYTSQNDQAVSVFETAMPDRTIIGVDCSSIIHSAGAVHCICMHVPSPRSPYPTVDLLAPNGGEQCAIGSTFEITWNAFDQQGMDGIDILLSVDGGTTFPYTIATDEQNDGGFLWTVDNLPTAQARIKVIARDLDGFEAEDISDDDFLISADIPAPVYQFHFNDATDPGWTTTGEWAFGVPQGNGGGYGDGGPDPTSGHTGDYVYGYNLDGNYAANTPEHSLTTTPIDCSTLDQVQLRFWRWLGVERSLYDHASLHVSANGTDWTLLWENTDEVADYAWVLQEFDISSVADGQPQVWIRWTMGTTDGFWHYCGWNIDDVEIWGVEGAAGAPGDLNCDGVVDFADINPFVLALSGQDGYEAAYPDCEWLNADCNGDDAVDFADINAFVAVLSR